MADIELDVDENEFEPQKKGGLVKGLLLAVIMAAAGGALGAAFLGPMLGQRLAAAQAGDSAGHGGDSDSHGGGGHSGDDHGGSGGGSGSSELFVLENLVVNPAGSQGTRFLLVTIAAEMDGSEAVEVLDSRDLAVRDALIRTLGSRTVQELADIELREEITQDIAKALDRLLDSGQVRTIYLPQYVIQ